MPVKLIQYWNIRHGHKTDFETFFTQEYVPKIDETGLMKIVASWHVASGEGPYFVVEGVSETIDEIESVIVDSSYWKLRQRLFQLVKDYNTKLLVPTSRVKPQRIEIEHGYKFNQHFNVNPADTYEYESFEEKEYIPGMERFGIKMVGVWNVAAGATPYVTNEGRVENLSIIGEMLQGHDYQLLILKLLNLVSNYGCKVLVPSGHINE